MIRMCQYILIFLHVLKKEVGVCQNLLCATCSPYDPILTQNEGSPHVNHVKESLWKRSGSMITLSVHAVIIWQ